MVLQFLDGFRQDLDSGFDYLKGKVAVVFNFIQEKFNLSGGEQPPIHPGTVETENTGRDALILEEDGSDLPQQPAKELFAYNLKRAQLAQGLDLLQLLRKHFGATYQESADRLLKPFFPNDCSTTSWLDDCDVRDALVSLAKEQARNDLKIAVVNPFDLTQPAGISRYLNELTVEGAKKKEFARFSQSDVLLCPVNLCKNHWGIWILDKRVPEQHQILCLDGFNSDPFSESPKGYALAQRQYFEKLVAPLAAKFGFKVQAIHLKIPPQLGTNDCGAVIDYWAGKIIENTLPDSSEIQTKNYESHRLEMAKRIVRNSDEIQLSAGDQEKLGARLSV